MKLKDFTSAKYTRKEAAKKSVHNFCENCGRSNPEMDEGYTVCCNEPAVDWQTALKIAKQNDICEYLNLRYKEVGTHGNLGNSNTCTFVLGGKNKSFTMNMYKAEKDLIEDLKINLKGIRSDKIIPLTPIVNRMKK
jgi:hypothetical protein